MTATRFPAWLERILIANGTMTETGLFRTAHPKSCPSCNAWTLAGLDADILAREIHADPTRLTDEGEAWALLEGRETFELAGFGRARRLEPREFASQIINRPAKRHVVLAMHKCNSPIPREYEMPEVPTPAAAAGF